MSGSTSCAAKLSHCRVKRGNKDWPRPMVGRTNSTAKAKLRMRAVPETVADVRLGQVCQLLKQLPFRAVGGYKPLDSLSLLYLSGVDIAL